MTGGSRSRGGTPGHYDIDTAARLPDRRCGEPRVRGALRRRPNLGLNLEFGSRGYGRRRRAAGGIRSAAAGGRGVRLQQTAPPFRMPLTAPGAKSETRMQAQGAPQKGAVHKLICLNNTRYR